MTASSKDLPQIGNRPGQGPLLPDEEADIDARLEQVREEKHEALADPGPPWREWFYFRASKWYVVLGFLIVLVWEFSYIIPPPTAPWYAIVPVIALTLYLQLVLYHYLWYQPKASDRSRSTRAQDRWRRWFYPLPYGRWTPESAELRAGRSVAVPESGPDPREFL